MARRKNTQPKPPPPVLGDRVLFTVYGCQPYDNDWVIREGKQGVYLGPASGVSALEGKGWHHVEVVLGGETHIVPVQLSMVESVAVGS